MNRQLTVPTAGQETQNFRTVLLQDAFFRFPSWGGCTCIPRRGPQHQAVALQPAVEFLARGRRFIPVVVSHLMKTMSLSFYW